MAKNIDPSLKLISEYLSLKKYEYFFIPEYQRAYTWTTEHCDQLWQDIETFIETGSDDPYFFGTIIVDCKEPKLGLIDGQQRTTTFLLLLKALLIRLNEAISMVSDDEESEALKAGLKAKRNKIMSILYKAEAEDIPSMLKDNAKTQGKLILENNSINELHPNEVRTIIESKDYKIAEKNVYKIPRKQKDNKYTNHFRNFKYFYLKLGEKTESQLNKFAKKLLDECQIIEIRSWDTEQAITMFNSLNSSGLPLSDADIISAKLYSKAGKDKEKFNANWKEINILVSELQGIVNIDSVLQQFMYINRAINKEYVNTKSDGRISVDVTTPGMRRYYVDIKKELLNAPLTLCDNLLQITNTWEEIKDYPIVKLLLKCNENSKLFLSSFCYRYATEEITEKKITELCRCLIRLFTLLELSDAGYSNTKFKNFLFKVNIKLTDKNISVDEIKKDFDEHIKNNWTRLELSESIEEYEKNLLVFLNEYIYSQNIDKTFDFEAGVNVEHIMPASGRNNEVIRQDADVADTEEFKSIVNKIGNKILLEENINKKISNDWFKTKKQNSISTKSGYKDSQYAIARALVSYPHDRWTKEDIDKATKKASERIVDFLFGEQGS